MTTLTGHDAITYAEQHDDMSLSKYADPTEGARHDVTPREAREIAQADAGLVYLDLPHMTTTTYAVHAVRYHDGHEPYIISESATTHATREAAEADIAERRARGECAMIVTDEFHFMVNA